MATPTIIIQVSWGNRNAWANSWTCSTTIQQLWFLNYMKSKSSLSDQKTALVLCQQIWQDFFTNQNWLNLPKFSLLALLLGAFVWKKWKQLRENNCQYFRWLSGNTKRRSWKKIQALFWISIQKSQAKTQSYNCWITRYFRFNTKLEN